MPLDKGGRCKITKAVKCRFASDSELIGLVDFYRVWWMAYLNKLSLFRINKSLAENNPNYYRCCSGFCIDLLEKFSRDLQFSYELVRVSDGTWGVLSVSTDKKNDFLWVLFIFNISYYLLCHELLNAIVAINSIRITLEATAKWCS